MYLLCPSQKSFILFRAMICFTPALPKCIGRLPQFVQFQFNIESLINMDKLYINIYRIMCQSSIFLCDLKIFYAHPRNLWP